MQKLFDLFKYKTVELIPGYDVKSTNVVASYKIRFKLVKAQFKAFIKDKLYYNLLKINENDFRNLNRELGLSTNTSALNTARKLVTFLTEEFIYVIFILTKYDNKYDLEKSLQVTSIWLPDIIIDLVNSLNCHKFTRRIMGSLSVVKCDEVKILTPSLDFSNEDDSLLNFRLLRLNRILNLLGFCKVVEVKDFNDLFCNHNFDLNCYVQLSYKDKEETNISDFKIIAGDGHSTEDIIMCLLTNPEITDTNNFYSRTNIWSVPYNDVLDILKGSKSINFQETGMSEIREDLVHSQISGIISQFSNISKENSRIDYQLGGSGDSNTSTKEEVDDAERNEQ